MLSEILNIIEKIIAIFGGTAGLIAVSYLLWKGFKGRISVRASDGVYNYFTNENKSSGLMTSAEIIIHNGKDESISITDALATLKYNEKKLTHAPHISNIVFSTKPTNFNILPLNIPPRQSAGVKLDFKFGDLDYSLIDRIPSAHFLGFLGKVPLLFADEREILRNWEKYPFKMLLSIHIDGDKIIKVPVSLWNAKTKTQPVGTIGVIKQAEIERDFLEKDI